MRIGVVGSGISGLAGAWLLSQKHHVDLYEAQDYLGGHANTVDVSVGGTSVAVDTGFMVFNRRTYPNFTRLLAYLGLESQPSRMSFSVRCEEDDIEWCGTNLGGVFAQRANVWRPQFHRMLYDIWRLSRAAERSSQMTPPAE